MRLHRGLLKGTALVIGGAAAAGAAVAIAGPAAVTAAAGTAARWAGGMLVAGAVGSAMEKMGAPDKEMGIGDGRRNNGGKHGGDQGGGNNNPLGFNGATGPKPENMPMRAMGKRSASTAS